jgi:hypothetical protein
MREPSKNIEDVEQDDDRDGDADHPENATLAHAVILFQPRGPERIGRGGVP